MNRDQKADKAIYELENIGIDIEQNTGSSIIFHHNGHRVIYFTASEWATSKAIQDGRGLDHLLSELKKTTEKQN